MSPLDKIKQAGFSLELEPVDGFEDGLIIEPSDKLTADQLAYLKANKQAIIDELLMTRIYTPNGGAFDVLAHNAEHQAFLLKMNPLPKEYQND